MATGESSSEPGHETPDALREGVREAVLTSLARDLEQRGAPTGRRLFAAGILGVTGALGAVLLLAGHPFGHHPPWHVTVFSTVWAGLLVVALATSFLRVRTPGLALASAAEVAILALALAGLCSLACPDRHFLTWWLASRPGSALEAQVGATAGAICFGLATTIFFAGAATLLVFRRRPQERGAVALPSAAVALLLAPGVALQAVGQSPSIVVGWLLATAIGAYLGVAAALLARSRLAA